MTIRALYEDKYNKVLTHLKSNNKYEKEELNECKTLLRKAIKSNGLNQVCYFNQLDFKLGDTFGVEIYIED